ncbi:MAG: heavy metal translocating P-type ATPase, partial [Clostridium sp.]|nr:heavy metal translocating P-type ATPase [Clostridium sp.]
MKIIIKNEIRGRIRFCLQKKRYTAEEADTLQFYLQSLPGVTAVKVYERTGSAAVCYTGAREDLVRGILAFSFDKPEYRALVPEHTGRALATKYREKIIMQVVNH